MLYFDEMDDIVESDSFIISEDDFLVVSATKNENQDGVHG